MELQYLDFDFSGDADGQGSFDAMASVMPSQLSRVEAEITAVLDWACGRFGLPQPVEEGGEWDCELQGVREVATALQVQYRPGAGLALQAGATGEPRVTLSLTLSGTPGFCDAFRETFGFG